MEFAIRDFNKSLKKNSVGLFYFAGHGLEIDGENYIVPIDASIEHESDFRYEALAVGRVLEDRQTAENGLNLVVDVGRNNPCSRKFRNTSGTLILCNRAGECSR